MAAHDDTPGAGAGGRRAGALRAAARLARADLFSRPGQTALTAVAIFAAATALVVTLALRAGLDDPFADARPRRAGRTSRSTASSATRTSPRSPPCPA